MFKTFLGLVLSCLLIAPSQSQEVGSVEAARYLADQANKAAMAEAEWNVAKKLCQNFEPIAGYKQTRDDFSVIEVNEGNTGFIQKWPLKVVSVVDDANAILSLGRFTFWLEDYPTNDLADGESVRVLDPVVFTKPRSYGAVSGAKKTVKAFRMLTKEEFAKHQANGDAERKQKVRDKRKAISQVFEFNDGKSIEAVFIDIKKGKVLLEDLDGVKSEHTLPDFNAESSKAIRELFKNNPHTAAIRDLEPIDNRLFERFYLADGGEIVAAFIDLKNGKATVQSRNGKTLELRLNEFEKKSVERIKELTDRSKKK